MRPPFGHPDLCLGCNGVQERRTYGARGGLKELSDGRYETTRDGQAGRASLTNLRGVEYWRPGRGCGRPAEVGRPVPSVWNRLWSARQRSGWAGRGRGAGGCESGCADAWIRKTFCELCCRIAHNSGLPDNQPTVETGPNTCCRTARQHANNTTHELMVEHPRGRPVVPPLR